jgi:hypothetical protein
MMCMYNSLIQTHLDVITMSMRNKILKKFKD